jgi:hypothetical protein
VALGIYFHLLIRRRLVLNVFPFPVSKAKLLGEFYNNRRRAANRCPCFAYPYVFFMLRQYYWRYDSYSANRQRAANMKNPQKSYFWRCEFAALRLLAQRRRPASPLSADIDVAPITDSI